MTTSVDTAYADAMLAEANRQAAADPNIRRADFTYDTVTAVNTDGTVSVGDIRARRYTAYTQPAVGDKVVLLQSGNRNWIALGRLVPATDAGGWTLLALGAGISTLSHGLPPAYLLEGKRVTLRGRCGVTSGTIANGATILTLPASLRPAGGVDFGWASIRNAPAGSNAVPNVVRVDIAATTGVLKTFEVGSPPTWVSLDGVSYFTD